MAIKVKITGKNVGSSRDIRAVKMECPSQAEAKKAIEKANKVKNAQNMRLYIK